MKFILKHDLQDGPLIIEKPCRVIAIHDGSTNWLYVYERNYTMVSNETASARLVVEVPEGVLAEASAPFRHVAKKEVLLGPFPQRWSYDVRLAMSVMFGPWEATIFPMKVDYYARHFNLDEGSYTYSSPDRAVQEE